MSRRRSNALFRADAPVPCMVWPSPQRWLGSVAHAVTRHPRRGGWLPLALLTFARAPADGPGVRSMALTVSTPAAREWLGPLQTGLPSSPASAECLRIARPARGDRSALAVPKPRPPLPPFPVTCRRPSPTMQRDLSIIRLCKPAPPQSPAKRLPAVMVARVDLSSHGAVLPDDPDRHSGRTARRGPCCGSGRQPGCQGQRHGAQRRRCRAGLHQHARGARPLSPAPSRQPGECPTDRLRRAAHGSGLPGAARRDRIGQHRVLVGSPARAGIGPEVA